VVAPNVRDRAVADPQPSGQGRVDQCVDPSAGFSVNVTRTTCSTIPAGSHGLRPRPSATTPTPATPRRANEARHARTVFALTPHRRPISSFATPSAASNRPCACRTARCGNDSEFAIATSSARCSSLISNRAADRVPAIPEYYQKSTIHFINTAPVRLRL
jgi:hypothetical protein